MGEVEAIPAEDLAAVIGPSPRADWDRIPKEEIVRLLLLHQRTLESVTQRFFVIPFKFGTTLRDPAELSKVLKEGAPLLRDLINRMRDCFEVDLVVTWEVPKVLQEIAQTDPEIVARRNEVAPGREDRVQVGMLLSNALKKRAEESKGIILEMLKVHAEAFSDHNLLNDTMVLNSSFLIHRRQEKEFYNWVEKINSRFENKLHFKCIGPLPPYSFATITLERFDPIEIRQAAKVLGLNGRAELSQVKKIYRELSKKFHPDASPDLTAFPFERLHDAYQRVADYCKEGPRSLDEEAIAAYLQLSVSGLETEICDAP
jgi:hypothetical protein